MDYFNTMDFDVFISALSYLGTLSFAISGFITASKKTTRPFWCLFDCLFHRIGRGNPQRFTFKHQGRMTFRTQ